MKFVIRDATVDDAEASARVSVDSWRSSYRGILPDEVLAAIDIGKRAAKRREILARRAALHLVACDAETDEIVGFCDAGANRDGITGAGEVYAVYIIERAKRQGLGRAMFERAQASLRAAGITAMSVWVIETNAPARRFYEALGGRPGVHKDTFLNGAPVIEVAYECLDRRRTCRPRASRTSCGHDASIHRALRSQTVPGRCATPRGRRRD